MLECIKSQLPASRWGIKKSDKMILLNSEYLLHSMGISFWIRPIQGFRNMLKKFAAHLECDQAILHNSYLLILLCFSQITRWRMLSQIFHSIAIIPWDKVNLSKSLDHPFKPKYVLCICKNIIKTFPCVWTYVCNVRSPIDVKPNWHQCAASGQPLCK
jgi:hypothetical protein